jgi:hypothetical protein
VGFLKLASDKVEEAARRLVQSPLLLVLMAAFLVLKLFFSEPEEERD